MYGFIINAPKRRPSIPDVRRRYRYEGNGNVTSEWTGTPLLGNVEITGLYPKVLHSSVCGNYTIPHQHLVWVLVQGCWAASLAYVDPTLMLPHLNAVENLFDASTEEGRERCASQEYRKMLKQMKRQHRRNRRDGSLKKNLAIRVVGSQARSAEENLSSNLQAALALPAITMPPPMFESALQKFIELAQTDPVSFERFIERLQE